MKKTLFTSLFLLIFLLLSDALSAQEVSTLIYDPDRRFEAMHWHEDGRIYAVDYYNGRLYQLYPDGTAETLLSGFSALAGGGFDAAGSFYVAGINTGHMFRLNPDNSLDTVAAGLSQPVCVLQDAEDADLFYVTEYGSSEVSTFEMSTGQVNAYQEDNGISGPDGIIYDWNGDILVSNWNNHKIHRINANGEMSLFCNLGQPGNMGYITLIGDYVFVPSLSGRKIFRVDMEGNATAIAGTGSAGTADGAAEDATFTGPNGICHNASGDTILVGDGHRVRILTGFATQAAVGVQEQQEGPAFQIGPNPVAKYLSWTWEMPHDNALRAWEVSDSLGRIVLRGGSGPEIYQQRIDTSELRPGTYILRFRFEDATASEARFVK